jgi:pyruvate/2-oxoglutarate dehydrogenase complex dihydrolipoamide acyltransferase (E2) component
MELINRICRSQRLGGELAYIYGLKARAKNHHCLGYGTFTVDVDALESLRKDYSRRIQPITYLPLYVKAAALAIQRNPQANAILFRNIFGLRIVQFEQVDVNLPITRKIGERWITFIGTIRNAATKTLAQIQEELTIYQRCPPQESTALRRFLRLDKMPFFMSRLVHWWMTRSPSFYIRNVGTCGVTIVDAGDAGGYFYPIAPTSVVFGISGVTREPVVRNDALAIGRVLHCVLMADNYVVSGLVGVQVVRDFKELLESGHFITEELRSASGAIRVS